MSALKVLRNQLRTITWVSLCIVSFLFQGCYSPQEKLIQPSLSPMLVDDSDLGSLKRAISTQLHYLDGFSDDHLIFPGRDEFRVAWLKESLIAFSEILSVDVSPLELDRIIQENFTIFQAAGRAGKKHNSMLVTGYFEPVLDGSLTRSPPYIHPLYSSPEDLVRKKTETRTIIGRKTKNGETAPYWTREEIDTTGIIAGYELVYLQDPFDAFLFHVQGSGKIRLTDGTVRSLQYASNNGHPYSSIGKLLVDEGKMKLEDVDIPAIRSYLRNHPDELNRILFHNHRYIFFQWNSSGLIRGSTREPLTAGRSIAIDGASLPMGTIGYLVSRRPVTDGHGKITGWKLFQRFVFPQDSGSAIRGTGRVDLFCGSSKYAETAAGAMKEQGKLYFLVKKLTHPSQ